MLGLLKTQSDALVNWVTTELGMSVFIAGEEGNQPQRPFAVLMMKVPPKHENLLPTKSRNPGTTDPTEQHPVMPSVDTIFYETFVLSVIIRDLKDAIVYSRALERSIDKTAVKTALNAVGLYCRYCANTASAEHKLSTAMEHVAFVDFKFALTSSFNEERYVIERVELSYE